MSIYTKVIKDTQKCVSKLRNVSPGLETCQYFNVLLRLLLCLL